MANSTETDRDSHKESQGPYDTCGGELIDDPIFNYRLRLSRAGDILRAEFWVEPGGGGKTEHYHPSIEERFRVVDGQITYRADGRKRIARAGTEFTVPAGVRHCFVNTGATTAKLVVEMEPALQMAQLFRDAATLGRERKWIAVGRRGIPRGPRSLLALAEFLDRYREIFVPTSPPPFLQRIAVPPLARLGRRRRDAA